MVKQATSGLQQSAPAKVVKDPNDARIAAVEAQVAKLTEAVMKGDPVAAAQHMSAEAE